MIMPLIDSRAVFQSGLGALTEELPLAQRTLVGTKGTVVNVYPVGHEDNPSGQTLVDIMPTNGLPFLLKVPMAHGHAHEETDEQAPLSERRNAGKPRARNRMEGSSTDVRHGTFVWVSFLGGSIHDPVVTATLGFNQKTATSAPAFMQVIDTIDADGNLLAAPSHPLDSVYDRDTGGSNYPRKVARFNGVHEETDNRGNRYIQTGVDREPIFKGHNKIPASPDPEGNFGVSTRGSRMGHIGFTTGKSAQRPEDGSKGRQFRRTIGADDGTIRDTTNSTIGHMIRRVRSGLGRMWSSTRGASDGRVYHEDKDRNYLALGGGAELHGSKVVLDSIAVHLGGADAASEIVLHPQVMAMLQAMVSLYDQHTHLSGGSGSVVPAFWQTPVFTAQKDLSKAAGVFADQSNPTSPTYQNDPEEA